jgi:hypothetical protein
MPPDLSPPMLEPRPSCAAANVSAAMVFPVVQATCDSGGGCHVGMGTAGGLGFGSTAATFAAATVGKASNQSALKLVVASKPNESYLLYKIYNQQAKAGGGGIMPAIGTLTPDQQCLFYNWVVSGAN